MYGFPPEQVTPTTRVWAGAFGVRELALPAALIATRGRPPELRLALTLAAASDLGDALVGARAWRGNGGIERAAAAIVVSGLAGSVASLAALHQARGAVSEARSGGALRPLRPRRPGAGR